MPMPTLSRPLGGASRRFALQRFLKPRLRTKILAIVVGTVLLGAVIVSVLILFLQRQQSVDDFRHSTQHANAVIQTSLEHAMITNDKAMLAQMLDDVAGEADLGRVRILALDGRVWLSSASEEEGQRFALSDPLCRACHSGTTNQSLDTGASTFQISNTAVLSASPIPNQPVCHSCHDSNAQTLGMLLIETPLTTLNDQLMSSFWQTSLFAVIIFLLLVGLLTPALGKLVIQPVVALAHDAKEFGAGNLDYQSRVKRGDDELGELAAAFDTMRQQLRMALVEKENRNRELQILNEVARATSQVLDPQQVLDLTIDIAVSSLGIHAGAIYLLDRASNHFTLHACHGMPECRELACHLWRFNRVVAGLTQPESQVVAVPITPDACSGIWQDPQGRSFVGVPLMAQGTLLGAMTLVTHPGQQVTEAGTRTLKAMGEEIGLALANAMRYQNVRNQATLEERERLAREMHDSLAQALGFLKMQASLTDDFLSSGQITQAQANLREVKEIAGETYANVREAIFGLRHMTSQGPEFLPALEEYLSEYYIYYGLDVQLVINDGCRPSFPTEVSLQVTRIIQEALTNIRKHARATQASICIKRDDHHWHITIADNGQGFDPQRVPKAGEQFLGLQIMRERAESIGAQLELQSQPGGGTRITLQIPFASEHRNGTTFANSVG